MNMMDIEEYIGRAIPTEQITADLLIKPAPRKKMMSSKIAAHQGKPRRGRGGGGPKGGAKGRPRGGSGNDGGQRADSSRRRRRRRPSAKQTQAAGNAG